jgi:hypothetical protein
LVAVLEVLADPSSYNVDVDEKVVPVIPSMAMAFVVSSTIWEDEEKLLGANPGLLR